jgi:hypothetical protein
MHDEKTTSQRTFKIGLRAPTGIYFPKGDTLMLKDFPSEVGSIDLVFSVNRLLPEGFSHPVRFGLWIDVSGPAPSMKDAVETFGNVARGMASFLSLAANAAIEEPTADVAIETTRGSSTREYWGRDAPEYAWPRGFGRGILTQVPQVLIDAWFNRSHDDRERMFRATVQYHHAIQHWSPGSEIAALSHIWIGMEALTKLFRARRAAELGLDLRQLTEHYAAERSVETGKKVYFRSLNDLDGEIRRRHFFRGDDAVYQVTRDASNAYEHSFSPLWEVREQAAKAVEPAASYLRQSILELLDIDDNIKALLLSPPFTVPYNDMLDMSLRGELSGTSETLDAIEEYPDIASWVEPFQMRVDEEDDAALGYRTRIAAQGLPSGVTFKPTGLDLTASPAIREGTGLLTSTNQADLAESETTLWQDATVSGRPASAILISGLLDEPIRTEWANAVSFDDTFELRVETTMRPEKGVDRADLLRSAELVRHEREVEGWDPVCVLPSPDDRSVSILYRRILAKD